MSTKIAEITTNTPISLYLQDYIDDKISVINDQENKNNQIISDFNKLHQSTISTINDNTNFLTTRVNNIKQYNTNISANHYPYLTNAINYNKELLKLLSTYYKIPEQFNRSGVSIPTSYITYKNQISYKSNRYKNILMYSNRNLNTILGEDLFSALSTYELINNETNMTVINNAYNRISNIIFQKANDQQTKKKLLIACLSGYNMYNDNNNWFYWYGQNQGFQDLTTQNSDIYGFPSANVYNGYKGNSKGSIMHEVVSFIVNLSTEYQYFTIPSSNYVFPTFPIFTLNIPEITYTYEFNDIYTNIKIDDKNTSLQTNAPKNYLNTYLISNTNKNKYKTIFNLRKTLLSTMIEQTTQFTTYLSNYQTSLLNSIEDTITGIQTRLTTIRTNHTDPLSTFIVNTYISAQYEDDYFEHIPWRIICNQHASAYYESFPSACGKIIDTTSGYGINFENKINRFKNQD